MTAQLNTGQIFQVFFSDFEGSAGFVEARGKASISYQPNKPGYPEIGSTVSVGGEDWIIDRVSSSPYVRGFRVLDLRRAG